MADKKRVLILYAAAGHGHAKAALAIEEAMQDQSGVDVKALDALTVCPAYFKKGYENLYLFLIRHLAWLWGFLYFLTDISFIYYFVRIARRLHNAYFAKMLEEYLIAVDPDVVVCTHFLGSEVVNHLKNKKRLRAKLIIVITDYLPHTFWIEKQADLYCVASEDTRTELIRRGVSDGHVRVTGIPVEEKFSQKMSRREAAAKLDVDPELFTVLVTSGGGGVGLVEPLVDRLLSQNQELQILAVCGTNQSLVETLRKKEAKWRIKIFGFVNNIHELMTASDLVVGKGGGLTITECLCLGKPMVLLGALPGQESRNVSCMLSNGSARRAQSASQAIFQVQEFMASPELLREFRLAAEKLGKPMAAASIREYIREASHSS